MRCRSAQRINDVTGAVDIFLETRAYAAIITECTRVAGGIVFTVSSPISSSTYSVSRTTRLDTHIAVALFVRT